MLYCPKCQQTYDEGTRRFCPNDNSRLLPAPSSGKSVNQTGGVFSNLLGNAIAHGSVTRPIQVRAISGAGIFQLSVANAGEPIPADAMERLFLPFFRATVGPSREGLGLGLYIAHKIATAHGGTLDVESTPEETRFTFRMPNGLPSNG